MTQPRAAYNEIDPKAAAWLRELIRQGLIAPGDVIEASIEDLTPNDLKPYTQVHFFAGIGVWSYALRRAGWPDDRPVWTGSCPCQPFSAAGKGGGFDDERHLWPAFHYLIDQCRPDVVFGEQVASKDGLGWLDLVQTDLEGTGYASGAIDLCAAGVGAPHIRQRLWWFGERLDDTTGARHVGQIIGAEGDPRDEARLRLPGAGRSLGGLADDDARLESGGRHGGEPESAGSWRSGNAGDHPSGELADTDSRQFDGHPEFRGTERNGQNAGRAQGGCEPGPCGDDAGLLPGPDGHVSHGAGAQGEYWLCEMALRAGTADRIRQTADWLYSRDGVWRPVEPGTFPLAHGAPARVGRLRGYGNAIVAPAAQAFIEAYLPTVGDYSDAA